MTTDGKKLDPFYRKFYKPTVLIIVIKRRKQADKKAK